MYACMLLSTGCICYVTFRVQGSRLQLFFERGKTSGHGQGSELPLDRTTVGQANKETTDQDFEVVCTTVAMTATAEQLCWSGLALALGLVLWSVLRRRCSKQLAGAPTPS